jgi:uncharacterized protein YndB with AHSA1/START domain
LFIDERVATLNAQSSITIHAPAAKVWEALTRPDLIKQWFFGVDTETDWKVGSPIIHTGTWQGKPYVDKGRILRFEPPKVLAHSHWSDLSGLPDREENYQQVTYQITERDGASELTISEVNIPNQEAQAISERSWAMVLNNLKELLEKG